MRHPLLVLLLLCGCAAARLEGLLDAPDAAAFDQQLRIHGPIESSEVPTLLQQAAGQDLVRARNAAALLTLSREPEAQRAVEQLGATSADLQVWSTAAGSLLVREQLELGKLPASVQRADMVRAGLRSQDPKTYRTAFQIAGRLKLPELQAEIPKALQSRDGATRALGFAALTPQQARERLPSLKASLQGADNTTFPPMAIALIKTGDRQAWKAVADSFLEHRNDNVQTSFVNHINFHMTPEIYAFVVDCARRPGRWGEEAFFILGTQVTQNVRPCDHFLMALALPRLKAAARTKKRDDDAEILVTVVSQGGNPNKERPAWENRIHGQAAVDFAEKWLQTHP